ncbi:hypothetical protein EYF80_026727 [Liparis tanakae]|uniref:Uncharacterized protein n=1 Tax=Liparis tanakae TaxID=230148 RepID=A0A4Z2HBV5_9TELE|nr:hypothetical protein EYF80_026727 [Liparis tanakae]
MGGWLADARPHGDIHDARCSDCRELGLSQKLALAGRLADHVTASVSGYHALGLGHPGGGQAHLNRQETICIDGSDLWKRGLCARRLARRPAGLRRRLAAVGQPESLVGPLHGAGVYGG